MTRMPLVSAITVLALLLAPLAACSSLEEQLCEAKCDCEGCTDQKHQECLLDFDADALEAEHRGCFGQHRALLDCEDATGYCADDDWKTRCKLEKEAYKACVDPK